MAVANCPICSSPRTGGCRCPGPHSLEDLQKGHGCRCENGHHWSGDLSWDPKVKQASKQPEVYAVDLDGTLAHHDPDAPFDPEHIGEPVKAMRNRVRQWTRRGIEVIIHTARADAPEKIKVVKAWLEKHGMPGLEVTNVKHPRVTKFFDDRAVQVEQNTGEIKEAAFHQPENFDQLKELSTRDYEVHGGANDWENTMTWALVKPTNHDTRRVWVMLPSDDDESGKWHDGGLKVVRKWVRLARETHGRDGSGMTWLESFEYAARELKKSGEIEAWGQDRQKWVNEQEDAKKRASAVGTPAPVVPAPIDPNKTGPDAIYRALQAMDLNVVEAEAKDVVRRKLKSKRPAAVEKLGFIQGLRKTGILPHELMISRVPVIPPMYRPHSVAGDTFVPGDANELYRDLLNLRGVHKDISERLVGKPVEESTLRLYDAVRSVYGFQDPVVPKTAERGVTGFLKAVTGTSPKFSFVQRKMLSRDSDFTGRGVITLDPAMHMDQVGIPEDMAWKIYGPHVQRRLVRSGLQAEEAIRHLRDRSSVAERHLDQEMAERPVIYSRAPAWHKFNVLGGHPRRIPGSSVVISPFVTTGMNADFDGDNVNVHVPSTADAVKDTYSKLMPSKMLYSIKAPGEVVPQPKHEYLLGIHGAQTRPARQKHQFASKAEALAAAKAGRISLSDEVEFPACHDDSTEVMTADGWVGFKDLDPLNLPVVWTINPATNYPQLQAPSAIWVYAVDGTLIQGLGPGLDFQVTEEHRMMVCSPMTDWTFLTARELLDRQFEPLLMMRTSLSDVATLEHHMLSRVPYVGKVYCLTVDNGTLVTRRQGVPLVSGNSKP